jgi:hypothetical protein
MGDVKSQHKPNYLILFNYFKVCGGDEARHEGYAINCVWQHISL